MTQSNRKPRSNGQTIIAKHNAERTARLADDLRRPRRRDFDGHAERTGDAQSARHGLPTIYADLAADFDGDAKRTGHALTGTACQSP